MKAYMKPEMEVLAFAVEDILRTSGEAGGSGNDSGDQLPFAPAT